MSVWEKGCLGGMALLFIFIHSSVLVPAAGDEQPKLECPIVSDKCTNDSIVFYLYFTNDDRYGNKIPLRLSRTTINSETFRSILEDEKRQTFNEMKVLLHGINGSSQDEFNRYMRNAYFMSGHNDLPILSVDYEKIVKRYECMSEAITMIPIIAKCTLEIMEIIVDNIKLIEKVHAIGFSYGTQVAGEIANLMKNSVLLNNGFYRITGLEVPIYQFEFNWGYLHDNSAGTVDVIHTNSGVLGEIRPIGTIDFYFNGGYLQKECQETTDMHLCSHRKAYEYFAESILYGPDLGGYFVPHFKSSSDMSNMSFLGNRGTKIISKTLKFGEYLPEIYEKGVYHITTNPTIPYGSNEYLIKYLKQNLKIDIFPVFEKFRSFSKKSVSINNTLTINYFNTPDGKPKETKTDLVDKEWKSVYPPTYELIDDPNEQCDDEY